MGLTEIQQRILKKVVERFLNSNGSTARIALVREFEDPDAIDQLYTYQLLKTSDGSNYLPTALSFHYCDDDEIEAFAKRGVEVLAEAFRNMYLADKIDLSPAGLMSAAAAIDPRADEKMIRLGLYLAPDFGLLAGFNGGNSQKPDVTPTGINERVVKLKKLDTLWIDHVNTRTSWTMVDTPDKNKTAETINAEHGLVPSSGNAHFDLNEVSEETTGARKSFETHTIVPLKDLPAKQACAVDLQSLLGWGVSVAVLYLDLDNFKAVNDKYRHEGGDVCIGKAAEMFGRVIQHRGRLYRLHATGDEFVILLPNFNQDEARATAERIRIAIEQQSPGGDIPVTASIGGVVATSGMNGQEALRLADEAMYAAKQIRNRVHFNTDEVPPPKKSSPDFKEISAMRDRDPDNENGQTPSPKQIAQMARKGSLYERDNAGKQFLGTRVCWKLRLREIWDRKNLMGEIGAQFTSRGNLGPTVHVIVRLKDYPALKSVRGGEFCEITGVIERVESHVSIYLADASIKFLPEPPEPEDPFEMIMNA
jgi:diguanylate cyclase (GGDEF)-like protein